MSTRKYSSKQEQQLAKQLGGRVQPNSGATTFFKGDVVAENWLIEAKTVMKEQASFSIKKEWIDKMKAEQFAQGFDYSALAFRFNPDGPDYFIIDKTLFKYLMEALKEEN